MYDLLVIGGGIMGTGVAADAAQRGLRVCLCEKNDLASGTSSYSSKLIHGGLRYLEQHQLAMVKDALQERDVLLQVAPHLVKPMPFIFPHQPDARPWWKIRLGVWLYDFLARHEKIPASQVVSLTDNPLLKNTFTKGICYWDCQTDDVRLVISNALRASQHGATLFTRTACTSALVKDGDWHVQLSNNTHIQARTIVNATGAWVSDTLTHHLHQTSTHTIHWVKGSHIIVPNIGDAKTAYTLQINDGRIIFVLPYQEAFSLIGTTDIPVDRIDDVHASEAEIDYLLAAVNKYFSVPLTRKDVLYDFAGVRGLYGDHHHNVSKISRDFTIEISTQPAPLLSILGGKLTTYRLIAEKTVDALRDFFPHLAPCTTREVPLPGGEWAGDIDSLIQQLCSDYPLLPRMQLHRYAHLYGTRCRLFLNNVASVADLGQHFGADLYEKEVRYLVEQELAQTAEDILWRRTKLALVLNDSEKNKLEAFLHNQY